MSYDYDLYCAAPFDAPSIRTTGACLISLDGPDKIEVEDIPDPYRAVTMGARVIYRIHVQGALHEKDQVWLDWWLGELITRANGVLIDLQTEDFISPETSGNLTIKRTRKPAPPMGKMEFVFEDSAWFYKSGFAKMLQCIADTMPAALPVRYGDYEPMQGKFADGGIPKLVAAFQDTPELFMKAKTPFEFIFQSIPCQKEFQGYPPKHALRCEHLLGHVSFGLRGRIFKEPRLLAQVTTLFKTLCVLLDVTYAQIAENENSDINWRWYGLPKAPARTVCIGPRYQAVWPDFSLAAKPIGLHHLIAGQDVSDHAPPSAPQDMIQPFKLDSRWDAQPVLPKVFPFDYVYDPKVFHW